MALATALSAWFNALALGVLLLRRGQFVPDRRLRQRLPRLLLAAAAMGVVLWVLQGLLFPAAPGLRFVALGVLITGGCATYFVAAHLLRAVDLREVRGMLRRRRKKAA